VALASMKKLWVSWVLRARFALRLIRPVQREVLLWEFVVCGAAMCGVRIVEPNVWLDANIGRSWSGTRWRGTVVVYQLLALKG